MTSAVEVKRRPGRPPGARTIPAERGDQVLEATKPKVQQPRVVVEIDDDGRGDLVWLPVDVLFVPQEYQRPLLEEHARDIAQSFDWRVFGTLVVSERDDGRFALVDGQNRCRAAHLRGITQVPCIAHRFASPLEEARVFDALNARRRAVDVWGRQRSGLFQGDPIAAAAAQFMAAIGTTAVPLATVRQMALRFTAELNAVTPLIKDLLALSVVPLRQDFLEGICVLEAMLGDSSLADKWRPNVMRSGYDDLLEGMRDYERRMGGYGNGLKSLKAKGDALLHALNTKLMTTIDRSRPNRNPHRVPRLEKIAGGWWEEERIA